MKNMIFTAILVVLTAALMTTCRQNQLISGNTDAPIVVANEDKSVSVAPKLQIDEKTRQALFDALADERRAQATYEAVLTKFGDVRPISNIVNAEKRHESFLLPLFEKYGVNAPENEFSKEKPAAPETLIEACKQGIEGEKANIAMYDRFLEFVKEDDIREVFKYLQEASKNNHLPAFERCTENKREGNARGRRF